MSGLAFDHFVETFSQLMEYSYDIYDNHENVYCENHKKELMEQRSDCWR